jgi:hypothetical protein
VWPKGWEYPVECVHCGKRNPADAVVCYLCGKEIARRGENVLAGSMIGTSYGAIAAPNAELTDAAARARRFLFIVLFILALPPLLAAVELYAKSQIVGVDSLMRQIQHQLFIAGGLVYLILVFGYLTANTAEATGGPFLSSLLMALFPPAIPAVWARIGGGRVWKPYLYFLIDAVILGGALAGLHEWPALALAVFVFMIPFIMYQVLGCTVTATAGLLGLYPTATIAWVCLGPALLTGLILYGALIETGQPLLGASWDQIGQELKQFAQPELALEYFPLKVGAIFYLTLSLLAWVRAIYNDLGLPLE